MTFTFAALNGFLPQKIHFSKQAETITKNKLAWDDVCYFKVEKIVVVSFS